MISIDEIKMQVQKTPNPNAKKYVLNMPVKGEGKISYGSLDECSHVPLAKELLSVEGIRQVHFYESVLTITKDPTTEWEQVDPQIRNIIHTELPGHDTQFAEKSEASREHFTVEMLMIDSILDRTIRPYLQSDGGDLEIIAYQNNILTVRYQGACGGCPSAEAGTLEAIIGTLRAEFNDEVDVVTV